MAVTSQMKAGRELDDLVARVVMGWHPMGWSLLFGTGAWKADSDRIITWEETSFGSFQPSSDWAAAGRVVGRMSELGWSFRLSTNACLKDQNAAAFSQGFRGLGQDILTSDCCYGDCAWAYCSTVPEAICLAALAAMESK